MTHLSTHILDLSKGLPAAGVGVSLHKFNTTNWELIEKGTTNKDGRINEFGEIKNGMYKLDFAVKEYFSFYKIDTTFPLIEVSFEVKENDKRLHIPLLLSPHGYSTYRGS